MKKRFKLFAAFAVAVVTLGFACSAQAALTVETGLTGNIFSDKAGNTVTLKYSGSSAPETYTYEITNYEKDTVLFSGSINGTGNETALSLPDIGYGAFYLKVKAESDEITVPYSCIMVRSDGRLNERMGVDAHFSWGWDEIKGSEVARKAGFSYVRDELSWAWAEPTKGGYYFPQRHSDIVNAILNEGMEPQYSFVYGNTLYTPTDRSFPETDAEQEAYVNYAYNTVKLSKGKIKYWRVWNEPNMDPPGIVVNTKERAESYMKLLVKVYNKIKPEFPYVQIGAFTTTSADWSADFIKWACDSVSDPMKYIDYISIQDYANPGNIIDFNNAWANLRNVVNSYPGGSDKEIWCNEYGYYDDTATDKTGGMSPLMKAAYTVVKSASMLANGYTDKNFVYVLSDKDEDLTIAENTYGLTERYDAEVGYAAKPVYAAITAFNSLTAGYEKCGTTSYEDFTNVQQYDFINTADRKNVSMLWSRSGTYRIDYAHEGADIKFLDMYGNALTPGSEHGRVSKPENGRYTITVTDKDPVYIVTEGKSEGTAEVTVVDEQANMFRLSGHMLIPGTAIIMVYPTDKLPDKLVPTEDIAYCEQIDTDEDGSFTVEFPLTREYSDFTAVISGTTMTEKLLINFSGSGTIKNVILITQNGETVKNLDNITPNDVLTIKTRVIDADILSKISLVYAVYDSSGALLECKIPELDKNTSELTASGEVRFDTPGAAKIKVYMWDMEKIYPLGEYKTLE